MALIHCPECGKEVSDKASVCPVCAYPIAELSPGGLVRIKLSTLKRSKVGGKQRATIKSEGDTIWEGNVGQIAEIYFDMGTNIEVQYHLSPMHYGGSCSGVIDPSKSKKYNVEVRQGIMKTLMTLQMVDVFDSD